MPGNDNIKNYDGLQVGIPACDRARQRSKINSDACLRTIDSVKLNYIFKERPIVAQTLLQTHEKRDPTTILDSFSLRNERVSVSDSHGVSEAAGTSRMTIEA